jgi:glycosyltransferase involved in cell wall biosynthesis
VGQFVAVSMCTTMRIGVDVGGLGPTRSGVARYLWEMLAGIMAAAPATDLVLYAQRPVDVPLPRGSWRFCRDVGSGRMPHVLWLQHRCPQLMAEDAVDVFWGQNYMLPLDVRHRCHRLLTVHDVTAVLFPRTMSRMSRLISRAYYRRVIEAADCVLADSHATARLARTCLGADPTRINVVYPGCDSGFAPMPEGQARAIVRDKFGLPPSYLLTVGNIEPRKDHITLLSALQSVPNAPVLAVIGSVGWRSSSIMAAIRRHETVGRVRFLGRVSDADLAALYSAAKLMVYSSFYEGFGLPVLEAMACGCPVLCSWSSSLPEVGGVAAHYFRPSDVNDLAVRIDRLLSDERLLARMRAQGVKRATAFTFGGAARQVMSLLPGVTSVT